MPLAREFVKATRKKAGISASAMGRAVGADARTVRRWEAGANEPSLTAAGRMAQVLGVRLDDLFEDERGHEQSADHDLSPGVTPENVQGGSTDGQDPKNDTGPEDAGKRQTSGPGHEEHTDESVGAVLAAAGDAR